MNSAVTQNIKLASLFALVAALMFAVTGLFVKLIGTSLPTTLIVFSRFSIALLLLFPWFLRDKNLFKITKPFSFIIRSIAALLSLTCMFYALKYVSLADGLLLNNTNALFVPMVAWILLGTKTPYSIWIIILIGFIGVTLVLNPDHGIWSFASLIGLASGLFGGISLVQLRQLTKTNTTQQILFYYFLISTIITGIMLIFVWQTPTLHLALLLLGVGVCGTLYQYCVVLSFTYAPVRLMSTLMFIAVLIGAFFDWWFWNNVPTSINIIGMILIIGASIASVYIGQKIIVQPEKEVCLRKG